MRNRTRNTFNLLVVISMLVSLVALMPVAQATMAQAGQTTVAPDFGTQPVDDTPQAAPEKSQAKTSHRLIVQLKSPSLSEKGFSSKTARLENGKLNLQSAEVQSYLSQLKSEQAAFVNQMQLALPGANVDHFINELGNPEALTYQVVFNGMTINPGKTPKKVAIQKLMALSGVKMVYSDVAHEPDLYASLPLINASAAWNNAAIGGKANAGAGVKLASMDGGLHKDAPMFDGTGYSYPPGFPAGGLGLTANNNGKIIASRVYFRSWDPPAAGDENPWPGTNGTSHGTHTGSTAGGNEVVSTYLGITNTISGVAPAVWLMSYRVFYASVNNDGSFYNAEGIAALEDLVADGADVVNNSWGGGPTSVGGALDALDTALINASNAGVFVSMSNGNAGPGLGTSDHPSSNYINVGASTTSGTLASGQFSVIEPSPPAPTTTLTDMPFTTADFGDPLPLGQVITYSFKTAYSVDPGNYDGCDAWPAGTFTGVAALISRGDCEFGVKVLNAENAGAEFAVIYNHVAGGDGLINMGEGAVGHLVTISSIFIGHTHGQAMVDWYTAHGAASVLEMDTNAFQAGNTPDIMTSFSSRGPGVGMVLKPDITAPGDNILAQGYDPLGVGEGRHLGWGQASGTSMASPHVAGAAALLRQIHPTWSNAEIKSALMSTSKYLGIYNHDGTHAQPLDMGAGRLDLTHAADPGVIFGSPSLSFGLVLTGTQKSLQTYLTNVSGATESYDLSAVSVSVTTSFGAPQVSALPGFTVQPASITLAAGEMAPITVTFDTTAGAIGDNQGFIVLGGSAHNAHVPVWGRVHPAPTADVLVIDNDFSDLLGYADYLSYYTTALTNLGISYDVRNADLYFANPTTIPDAAWLHPYKAIIYFTGDNFNNDGTFTVSTPLTALDMDILVEYANAGGIVLAMGQDIAAVLNADTFYGIGAGDANTFYSSVLGGNWHQDSLTNYSSPTSPVVAMEDAPRALQGVELDVSGWAENLVKLIGANEVPPVASLNVGDAYFTYDAASRVLYYDVTVKNMHPTDVMTITAAAIYTGTASVNGAVVHTISATPTALAAGASANFAASWAVVPSQVDEVLGNGFYVNVLTTANPTGEMRGQVTPAVIGDGARNQLFIDEIQTYPFRNPLPLPTVGPWFAYTPLLRYADPTYRIEDGVVAMAHREQPSLENPGVTFFGRSIYTSFGLEGVHNGVGTTTREGLLAAFLDWAMDEPGGTITDLTAPNSSHVTSFEAGLTSNISGVGGYTYRWDFGDSTEYAGPFKVPSASHVYDWCGTYNVRVEIVDTLGNHTIVTQNILVDQCTNGWRVLMPLIGR